MLYTLHSTIFQLYFNESERKINQFLEIIKTKSHILEDYLGTEEFTAGFLENKVTSKTTCVCVYMYIHSSNLMNSYVLTFISEDSQKKDFLIFTFDKFSTKKQCL